MNMQMLKEFLGIEFNKDKKILQSSDTKIGKIINQIQNTKTIKAVENQGFFQAHFKKHHIIFIDFQNVKGDSIQEIQTLLRIEIRKLYNSHDYIIPILAKKAQSEEAVDGILKMFQKYNGHVPLESAEMKNSLFFLSEILHKYFDQPQALYNEKVIIMIDEYDTPINASVANSRIDEQTIDIIQSFFDSLLCTTFKGNEHLLLGIMTGISGMVRASGRSGLNNVTEFKFLSDFNTLQPYYFLNEEQVNFLLQTIELNSNQHVTRELKRYYNGYTDVLYNPWSVFKQSAYMLQNKENIEDKKFIFKSYWCKTGNISFVHQLFHFPIIKEIIIKLIQKEQYTFTLRDELNIDDLKILKQLTLGDQTMSMNNVIVDLFLSYIFELGYLTHDGQNNYKIPNEEIRQEFLEIMFYYFEKTYNLSITNMTQATRAFNTLLDAKNAQDRGYHMDNFKQLLNTLLNRVSFSQIKDSNEGIHPNEDLFHSLLNIIVWKSTKLIKFATEASSYNPLQPGRLDIVFITDHAIGGIIEVKYSDNLSASKIANVALTQINTKDYDYIFKTHHSKLVKNVFKIGIGFSNIINQHVDVQYIFNPLQETSLDNISARKSKKRKINDDNNSYEKMDFTQSQMMDKDIIQQNNGDITPSEEINVIGDTAIPNMF